MHEGALQALDLLHTDLILRRDEARDESARETWDEVLTQVDALLTEYRRRLAALPQRRQQLAVGRQHGVLQVGVGLGDGVLGRGEFLGHVGLLGEHWPGRGLAAAHGSGAV